MTVQRFIITILLLVLVEEMSELVKEYNRAISSTKAEWISWAHMNGHKWRMSTNDQFLLSRVLRLYKDYNLILKIGFAWTQLFWQSGRRRKEWVCVSVRVVMAITSGLPCRGCSEAKGGQFLQKIKPNLWVQFTSMWANFRAHDNVVAMWVSFVACTGLAAFEAGKPFWFLAGAL